MPDQLRGVARHDVALSNSPTRFAVVDQRLGTARNDHAGEIVARLRSASAVGVRFTRRIDGYAEYRVM